MQSGQLKVKGHEAEGQALAPGAPTPPMAGPPEPLPERAIEHGRSIADMRQDDRQVLGWDLPGVTEALQARLKNQR
jgi:hypothetical protein